VVERTTFLAVAPNAGSIEPEGGSMRSVWVVLLAVLMSACAGSSSSDPPTTPVDGHPLSEFLPTSVNGVDTTRQDLDVLRPPSPRVFPKTLGRLSKTPADAELALAYVSSASVYAFRIDGVSGADTLLTFIAESANLDSGSFSTAPTISVGGKQVMRVGELVGTFLYSSDDVFYYLQAPDEPTAVDMLQQLP
jgi:hypothetical protein